MVTSVVGLTRASHRAILGASASRLPPATAAISSSDADAGSFSLVGMIRVPGELRAIAMRRVQMGARSRSTPMTVAPAARSSGQGPMAEPAPRRTKVLSRKSMEPLPVAMARRAAPVSGSMTPYSTHASTLATSEAPRSSEPWYGTTNSPPGPFFASFPTMVTVCNGLVFPGAVSKKVPRGCSAPPSFSMKTMLLCRAARPARAIANVLSAPSSNDATTRSAIYC
mmetsp:Transcript_6221/g.20310  ORF Transcript_6221/g.20310 Transcript_6221/m.20310 type:complete len:225 (+) Transcript_6221:790-1464(+)